MSILVASYLIVAKLSVKTTLASKTPSFLASLDSIVLAHPISQDIPDTFKESISALATVVSLFSLVSSFFASDLQLVMIEVIKNKTNTDLNNFIINIY